jgi:translation elongation factor EF-Tu-like GTPase
LDGKTTLTAALSARLRFAVREGGRTVGSGVVTNVA